MSVLHESSGEEAAVSRRATIMVEFGPLTEEQQAFADLHTLRAVGTEPPAFVADNGVVALLRLRQSRKSARHFDNTSTRAEEASPVAGWRPGASAI